MPKRYFTAAQANALLATLRPLLAAALAARERIVQARPDLWPVLEKAAGNGGSPAASAVARDFDQIHNALKSIQALGVEIKDVNTGLVDFLAKRAGRDIYLCWRYDEPRVAFWHDLESGFAGRQPL